MTPTSRSLVPILFGAVLLVGQVPAHATADGPDLYRVAGVAVWDKLNMRAGPATNYRVVGRIPHDGRGIENLGGNVGRWHQVRYQGTVGWVHTGYLAEDAHDDAWPAPRFRVVGVAWNDVLNVRAGPTASATVVGALAPGTNGVAHAGGCVGAWCLIVHGATKGWVNMRFLTPDL